MEYHPVVRSIHILSNSSLHLHSTWRFSFTSVWLLGEIIAWPEGILLFVLLCVGISCVFLSIGGSKHLRVEVRRWFIQNGHFPCFFFLLLFLLAWFDLFHWFVPTLAVT